MKRRSALAAVIAVLTGCGGGGGEGNAQQTASAPTDPGSAPALETAPPPATNPSPKDSAPPPPANVAAWGDSLTVDYVADLRILMPERTIFNGGAGGQTSTQIAARQGGAVPLVRLDGDLIAAAAVQVVSQSVRPITDQGVQQLQGSIAGVPGTLARRATDNTYWFTRATAGDPVSTNAAGEAFMVETAGRRAWPTIFWYGRNNFSNRAQVLADLAASIAFLEPGTPFLVMSVLNASNETKGSGSYVAITALNMDLQAAYPSNFVDVRAHLVASYDPAQAQDVLDHAADVIPSSLRRDALHMNAAGKVVLARFVKNQMLARAW